MTERLEWRAGPHVLECGIRTLVMGVLNVTPDSFSDGGRFLEPEVAAAQGIRMVADGADLIDVGGESTRPGSDPVGAEEEIRRAVPVIQRLAAEVAVPISIDTRKPEVARAALAGAGMVLMHMRGEPKDMQQHTQYSDVVAEVRDELRARVGAAVAAGIEPDRLVVDPGLGFAKSYEQNFVLMRDVRALFELGRPLLVGPSRKSFLGRVLGDLGVDERLEGTAGSVAWLAGQGAHAVRVHDVREMVRVVRVVDAIRRGTG